MRFVLSTATVGGGALAAQVEMQRAAGADGVELRVTTESPDEIRQAVDQVQLPLACIATDIRLTGNPHDDEAPLAALRRMIDLAVQLKCPMVRLWDTPWRRGRSTHAAALELAASLIPLADRAAEQNLTLAVENRLSLRTADAMWNLMEAAACHRGLAVAWNLLRAAQVGESPHLSVPTLNTRIRYVLLCDARQPTPAETRWTHAPMGDGTLAVQACLTRLRGIGFDGWLALDWDPTLLSGIPDVPTAAPDALAQLRQWLAPRVAKSHRRSAKT